MHHLSFEPRRRKELYDELASRARAWLADWHPRDEGDFATALFKIVARIESEVTQRLDKAPEKTFRGFLDWLGVKGKPARAARMPVVFTMTPGSDPVDAPAPVQLQLTTPAGAVSFETERPLRILPGSLATIVAVEPSRDAFYQPPASIFSLEPAPVPNAWTLKSDVPEAATTLQLDPPLGLEPGITLSDPSGQQYRVTAVQGAIVTVEPAIGTIEPKGDASPVAGGGGLPATTVMTRVNVFTPFSPTERNRQEHALYIGSAALNIATPAWIEVVGRSDISPDARWWYSGKPSPTAPDGWVEIKDISRADGRLLLYKPKPAIETMKIDGYESRWLRATVVPAGNISKASTARDLRLLINCDLREDIEPAPLPVRGLEGIANTAPLVLDAGFYPFGREPRQFDSFYLGSKEVFSKPAARVIADFKLGDTVSHARAAIGLSDTEYLTVGISNDGRLQRIAHGMSGGLPTVTFRSPSQPVASDQRPVTLNSGVRPGAAVLGGVPRVTAAAGNEVWLWREIAGREEWLTIGKPSAEAARVTSTVITQTGLDVAVYAIADGKLYRRVIDGEDWAEIELGVADPIALIAPIVRIGRRAGEQTEADGLIAVTKDGNLLIESAGDWDLANGGPAIDPTFYPLVVLTSGGDLLCMTRNDQREPVAFDPQGGFGFPASNVTLLGHALDFTVRGNDVMAVMAAIDDTTGHAAVAVWDGFNDAPPIFDPSGVQPAEGPLVVGVDGSARFIFVPDEGGRAHVTRIGRGQFLDDVAITDAALFTDAQDWSAATNLLIDIGGNINLRVLKVERVLLAAGNDKWLFELEQASRPAAGTNQVDMFEAFHAQPRAGIWRAANELELAAGDADASANRFLSVDVGGKRRVIEIDSVSAGIATLKHNMPAASDGDPVPYRVCRRAPLAATLDVELLPAIDIHSLDASIANALLTNGVLKSLDSTLTPASQHARYVIPADIAVLASPWDTKPDPIGDFFADVELFGSWTSFDPPTPRNPTLSWEYFDGTAWRQIPGLQDHTQGLAKAGIVTFCVPRDLQPTEVVGRTNHWIRARLVGGDYGQETVTVTTAPGKVPGTTTQTVSRSTDSIRAPYVGSLEVRYQVCCPVTPDVVLSRDNGGLRSQTDVNRSAGAIVEYFTPLSESLTRAAGNDATAGATDRALYLGFDTPLTGGPIQILFLVDEGAHDAAFPLRVDAIAGQRFKPVVIADNTRGLNESGTLDMTLAESPEPTELFGAARYWLRVRPGPRLPENEWQPRIRGAYLNATFAVAADTQRFELLGSSDGSPHQRFALARPPVLEGSLALRVLERLGDEDIAALRQQGVDVKDPEDPDFPKRPIGCWVLWRQVIDPADEGPAERVYALDDETGVITFGNGEHGMIPPIGRDVILAESYQRGGGAAANAIPAWTKINLVTSLAGVNDVLAPEGAAGGADPQDPATTLRFAPANLRLRDRALTLADFEVLALQFSREIAQVRAIRTARGGMRLVVAMRGRSSMPSAAVIRELETYLLDRASPGVAGGDRLDIVGPREITVRLELTVTIDAIEWSGAVANEARTRLERLLDAATGGHDGAGWKLGDLPSEADLAGALVGIPHVEEIVAIDVARTDGQPLTPLQPSQLVRLAVDGVVVKALLAEKVTS